MSARHVAFPRAPQRNTAVGTGSATGNWDAWLRRAGSGPLLGGGTWEESSVWLIFQGRKTRPWSGDRTFLTCNRCLSPPSFASRKWKSRGVRGPFAPCAGAPGLPSSLDMQSPGGRARGQRAVLRCDSLSLSEPGLQRRKARASSPLCPHCPRVRGLPVPAGRGAGWGWGRGPAPNPPGPAPNPSGPAPPARGAGKSRSGGGSGTCCGRICAWARRSCGGRWAGARLGVPPAGRGAGGRPVHGGRCAARVPAQVAQGGEPEAGMPARRRKGPCHRRAKGRGRDRLFPKASSAGAGGGAGGG